MALSTLPLATGLTSSRLTVATSLEHQHQREKKSHEKKQKTYCGPTDGQYAPSAGIYTPHWVSACGRKVAIPPAGSGNPGKYKIKGVVKNDKKIYFEV